MRSAKKVLAVVLSVLMLALCVVPAFAEDYEYTPETCPGHVYGEGAVTPRTCTAGGYTEYTCTLCGNTKRENETNPAGHSLQTQVVDPTCAESGYTLKTCANCDYSLKTNYVSPTGNHNWQPVSEQAPTCGVAGFTRERCGTCGNYRTTPIAATGAHTWQLTGTRAATCAVNGENYYLCTGCGAEKAENIPATGAHVDNNKDNMCDVCGQSVRAEGPSSGRTFMNLWDRFFGFFWNLFQRIGAQFS